LEKWGTLAHSTVTQGIGPKNVADLRTLEFCTVDIERFGSGSKDRGIGTGCQHQIHRFGPRRRVGEAKKLLQDHKDNVYDILASHDPLPALGVLYPLAVFLKHGKVNMELLTGEGGPGGGEE
jgi:hypothetical protein